MLFDPDHILVFNLIIFFNVHWNIRKRAIIHNEGIHNLDTSSTLHVPAAKYKNRLFHIRKKILNRPNIIKLSTHLIKLRLIYL